MKRIISLFAGLLCLSGALAQNEIDALRYSQYDIGGSARYVGMAGAMGGLGADLSTLSTNPAGIGLFRRSEFAFTLGFADIQTNAAYQNNLRSSNFVNTNVNNVGIVGSYKGEKSEVIRINFGIAYNKLRNFNQDMVVHGTAENTTLLNVFVLQAEGIHPDDLTDAFPFGAGLAYQTYLIDPLDSTSTQYMTAIPYGTIDQTKRIERRGSMGETVLSGGANISDQVFFGLTIGFPTLRYTERSSYEEGELDPDLDLDGYIFNDDLSASGNGINFKAGILIKPADWVRFGAAIHSPTWWSINEQYERSMYSFFKNGDSYEWDSPLGNYQFRLTTPARYMANTAFVLGKIAVLNADYEYVDYRQNQLRSSNRVFDDYDFAKENSAIEEIYKGTHNVRAGAEWRVVPAFRLRGGVAYQQSAFMDDAVENNAPILTYAGGLGYRKGGFFTDVGYSVRTSTEDYYLYDPGMVDVTTVDKSTGQLVVSVGFRY